MRLIGLVLGGLAALATAAPVHAAIFSFSFAFPGPGIADVPGSIELTPNDFDGTEVRVVAPVSVSLFRLRQTDSDALLAGLAPPGADVDLVLGGNRFEIDDQAFDPAGQLIGTFDLAGTFSDTLGLVFDDGGDIFTFYPDLPFFFYVDGTADYDGIGPFTGSSDVIWFTMPGDTGLYRLQAAIPEPGSWALMIAGFGCVGFALRRRRDAPRATPAAC